jgi:hypothetical protein
MVCGLFSDLPVNYIQFLKKIFIDYASIKFFFICLSIICPLDFCKNCDFARVFCVSSSISENLYLIKLYDRDETNKLQISTNGRRKAIGNLYQN